MLKLSMLYLKESSQYEPSKPWLKQQKKRIKKGSDFNAYNNFQKPFQVSSYITGSKDKLYCK